MQRDYGLVRDWETILRATLDGRKVDIIDDGFGPLWIAGNEYGATHIIRADSYASAYEALIDELPTVPDDELHEAYGFWTTSEMEAWNRAMNGDSDESDEALLRNVLDRGEVTVNGRTPESVTDISDDAFPDLLEGCQYQSNATGSGIVYTGHYEWMNEPCAADRIALLIRDEDGGTFVRMSHLD